jgi:maltose alpha-D-glucosyltransferase/alpha-amylase
MSQTGRRLAELHLALAGNSELPDFAPEEIRPEHVEHWIATATERAQRVFGMLKQRRDSLKEADQGLVDQLLAHGKTLRERLATLLQPDIDGFNIRHHGDFGLRQLLIVKDDIFIIDFDGGTGRSLAERRQKAPAARDVAALIRSIDYSVTAALERALKVAGDEQGRLAAALTGWRDRATAAFLAGYDEIMTGQRLWPADPRSARELLNFFLLERAVNDIEYELSHRPELLRVPLTAIPRILPSEPANETS